VEKTDTTLINEKELKYMYNQSKTKIKRTIISYTRWVFVIIWNSCYTNAIDTTDLLLTLWSYVTPLWGTGVE